jgi:predicted PurR-regulated permease PerM
VLITLAYSQETALAVLLLYIGVYWLVGSLVTPLLQGEAVNLHPAILAMVLVAGSQFGLLGILVAAPLAVISRDLFRYVYGRTSDPPRPAGVLPGGESITGHHNQ